MSVAAPPPFDSSGVTAGADDDERWRSTVESRNAPSACPAYANGRWWTVVEKPRIQLVMSRSAVRFRSSAPHRRLRNQGLATGGGQPAPKLESAPDNNATAAGDRRRSCGRGWTTIGRGPERPAGPQGAQVAPGRVGASAPCPRDPCGFQAAVRADPVARRRVATGSRGGRRPTGASVGSWESSSSSPWPV